MIYDLRFLNTRFEIWIKGTDQISSIVNRGFWDRISGDPLLTLGDDGMRETDHKSKII